MWVIDLWIKVGVVRSHGTKPMWFRKYDDGACDFGFNLKRIGGLYFWIEWSRK